MIACPSRRKAPSSGGASSSSSTSATSRCRMRATGRYHSRSQCVCDTTCTSNRSRDVIAGQAGTQEASSRWRLIHPHKKGRPFGRPHWLKEASGHRSPPCDQAIDDHDERDHQEEMDYRANVEREGTEEPKDEQDDGNRPE